MQAIRPTELNPYQIVRLGDGPMYFGLSPTQISEKIRSGEIPEPQYLTSTGRARGWTGQQIIDWHKANAAAQGERAKAALPRREQGKAARQRQLSAAPKKKRGGRS